MARRDSENYGYTSKLGEELGKLRTRAELSQLELAGLVGVSDVALRTWEAGVSSPKAKNLKKLIEVHMDKGTFTRGKEQVEAKVLWESAREKGLKEAFDEEWFKELSIDRQRLLVNNEQEVKPQASDSDIGTHSKTTGTNQTNSATFQPPENKTSRRAFLVGLICFVAGGAIGGTAGSLITRQVLQRAANWNTTGNMLLGRGFCRATKLLTGVVLIEGGEILDGSNTSESELFNPLTGIWSRAKGKLNEERREHTATLLQNGQVLVTGGYADVGKDSAELYDPIMDRWTLTKQKMHQTRTRHTATLLQDGRVLIVGGVEWLPKGGEPLATAELYDPTADTWSLAGQMATPRADHVAVRLWDGRVLVAGGTQKNDGVTKTQKTELYDPIKNSWIPGQDMIIPRAYFTAVLLLTGKVLTIGGRAESDNSTMTAEIYDSTTGSWSMTGQMHASRQNSLGQEAWLLDNGTVLVAGGDESGTSEIYMPDKGAWTNPLQMNTVRCNGATTLLEDGQILVIGGFSNFSSNAAKYILSSAEIYFPG